MDPRCKIGVGWAAAELSRVWLDPARLIFVRRLAAHKKPSQKILFLFHSSHFISLFSYAAFLQTHQPAQKTKMG